MKSEPEENLPDLLRKRITRQRKRLKFVRFTFALTVVLSVLLLFAANQSQTLAPNARVIFIVPHKDALWMLDQHMDLTADNQPPSGSFGLVRYKDGKVVSGMRYDGLIRNVTAMGNGKVGVTTASRFMEFDASGDDWKRTRLESLGLDDPSASPVVVWFRETLWMCWVRASDIMVQPYGRPEVAAKSLQKTHEPGATLQARVTDDAIWLSILEDRKGSLTLVSFTPGMEPVPEKKSKSDSDADDTPDPADNAKPEEPKLQTTVKRLFSSDVTANLRSASFAVIPSKEGPRPVVAISRKDDSDRAWHLRVWTRDKNSTNGRWEDAEPPARKKPAGGLEITNFLTLGARGDKLEVIYSEAGKVKIAQAGLGPDGAVNWPNPEVLPLDHTVGPTAYIIWVTVLFAMLLVMASQGVWLLLNRERAMDRTLAEIIDNQDTQAKKGAKDAPKLLYANSLARAVALLLDLAITSPVIILLQGFYGYTWNQAYGFLAIGSVAGLDSSILPTIVATGVTLMVLSIYSMGCELMWGRTFGKALFRLRVVDAEGEQPAGWRIVVRNLLKIVELIHWIVLLVPMGLMMMSGKQQRLGDLLAGTFVIVDVIPDEAPDDIDI